MNTQYNQKNIAMMTANKPIKVQSGFTLVELLVALMIFAMLAAGAWQVFGQLQKTYTHVSEKAEKMSALQFAYLQIEKDIFQLVNRPVPTRGSAFSSNLNTSANNFSAGLMLSSNQLSFTKTTSFDPRYIGAKNAVKLPLYERITYELKDKKLVRLSVKNVDDSNSVPLLATVLADVEKLDFSAFDIEKTNLWPPLNDVGGSAFGSQNTKDNAQNVQKDYDTKTQLPVGIAVSFEYMGTPVIWRFSLVPPLPDVQSANNQSSQNQSQKNKGNSQVQGQGGQAQGGGQGQGGQTQGGQSPSQSQGNPASQGQTPSSNSNDGYIEPSEQEQED